MVSKIALNLLSFHFENFEKKNSRLSDVEDLERDRSFRNQKLIQRSKLFQLGSTMLSTRFFEKDDPLDKLYGIFIELSNRFSRTLFDQSS